MSERGRVRYPAVCSCFLPLIVHFIIAQAADLVLAQTAGAGGGKSGRGRQDGLDLPGLCLRSRAFSALGRVQHVFPAFRLFFG